MNTRTTPNEDGGIPKGCSLQADKGNKAAGQRAAVSHLKWNRC